MMHGQQNIKPHFVMCVSPTGLELTYMWKYFKQQSPFFGVGEHTEDTCQGWNILKWNYTVEMSKKITSFTCTAKEHVWVTMTKSRNKKNASTPKTTVVQKLNSKDNEARLNFVNWYCHAMHNGETDLTLILIGGQAWFHLSSHGLTK
jgi:hypothetical protein